MKLAGADFLIWLVIFVVISLVQGWKHFQGQGEGEEEAPAPPPTPRRPARPAPTTAPPVIRQPRAPEPASWRADERQMQELRRRLKAKLDARQATPPPMVQTVPAPEPVQPPTVVKTIPRPVLPAPVVPRSAWVNRLRDRRSARDAVIAAEIFGAPKGA